MNLHPCSSAKPDDMEIPKTDVQKIVSYLDDAAKLYTALAALPIQKCNCRAEMIKRLTDKLKLKLNHDKNRFS